MPPPPPNIAQRKTERGRTKQTNVPIVVANEVWAIILSYQSLASRCVVLTQL